MTEGRQVDLKRRVSSFWLNQSVVFSTDGHHTAPVITPQVKTAGDSNTNQEKRVPHHPQQRLHQINDWNQHNCPTSSYSFYFQTFSLFKKGMWTMIVHWQLLGCIIIIQQAPCFKLCLVLWKQQLRVLHHHQENQRSLTLMALCSEDL